MRNNEKLFNTKLKKMQMEVDEINREKKKKRRMTEDDDGEVNPEDQDVKLQVPQGFNICNTVMDFKLGIKTSFYSNLIWFLQRKIKMITNTKLWQQLHCL
jgi:hypothetical protein